ncbi:MAG: FG-GAP repeat domain-containing protein, partial [Nannocystaceae bacterium]
MWTRWTTWARCGLLAPLLVLGCASDRTLTTRCGDGVHEAGEVCLGPEVIEYELDFEVHALRAADFTGDSVGDLLILGVGPPALTGILMIGDETSPLLETRDPLVSGCSAHPVTGSLNPDAITDLLVAACEPALIVFHGSASGQFELGPILEVPAATRTSSLHDADSDGIDDLLILGGRPQEIASLSVLPGTGEGNFGVGIRTDIHAPAIPNYNPNAMALTDLDSDGLTDVILVESERTGGLAIARGQPGGSFATPEPIAPNLAVRAMTLADLDEDGRQDLIVA